jgi:hypothetical protein
MEWRIFYAAHVDHVSQRAYGAVRIVSPDQNITEASILLRSTTPRDAEIETLRYAMRADGTLFLIRHSHTQHVGDRGYTFLSGSVEDAEPEDRDNLLHIQAVKQLARRAVAISLQPHSHTIV